VAEKRTYYEKKDGREVGRAWANLPQRSVEGATHWHCPVNKGRQDAMAAGLLLLSPAVEGTSWRGTKSRPLVLTTITPRYPEEVGSNMIATTEKK